MIGEEELAAMKKGSVLINISRGSIIDEEALIRSLESGHLGGVALDVASKEPLPPESPLWDMPNVIISPHSASTADNENEKLTEIWEEPLGFLHIFPIRVPEFLYKHLLLKEKPMTNHNKI